jgi:DNA-binding NarL/FixJ family response regulator
VSALQELVRALDREQPDVCLVDVRFDGGGMGAIAEVVARKPSIAAILLVDEAVEVEFMDAIRIGAAGYVLKSIAPASLPNVIRAVAAGEAAVPRSFVAPLIHQYRKRPTRRHVVGAAADHLDLTSREWEVLDFMRVGLSTREIAAKLFISEVTVRRHISSVLHKLHVRTRAEALELLRSA